MKKIYLRFISSIIFIVMTLIIGNNSYAMTPIFTYSCALGVSGYYYVHEGTSNLFYGLIVDAADNWEHTGYGYNPIYLTVKSNNNNTLIDIYNEYGTYWNDPNVLGETIHRDGQNYYINPNYADWAYAEIHLNETLMGSSSITDDHARGTIAHEIGHAFGLAHYNSNPTGSIMCQSWVPRTVQTVQQEDNDAINYKY